MGKLLMIAGVLFCGAVLFVFAARAMAEPLEVGAPAPDAASVDENGAPVKLSDVFGKGPTLVYFFPKADTPGCTRQACNLRDSFEQLQKAGLQVIGVSTDKPEAQKAFKEKYHLPFTLLADSQKNVVNAFGVPATGGFAARQSFLIKDGKIIWRDLKATPDKQAQDVLAALNSAK